MHVLNYIVIGILINAIYSICLYYCCLPHKAFAESVEVNEELLNSYSFFEDISLESFLNI